MNPYQETHNLKQEISPMPKPIEMLIDIIDDRILFYQEYQENSMLDKQMFFKEIKELKMVKTWAIGLEKFCKGCEQ
jgi:hypothetical protein